MHINNANKRARPSPLGQIKWQSLFTALPGDGRCLLWWRRGLMSLLLRLGYLSSPLPLAFSVVWPSLVSRRGAVTATWSLATCYRTSKLRRSGAFGAGLMVWPFVEPTARHWGLAQSLNTEESHLGLTIELNSFDEEVEASLWETLVPYMIVFLCLAEPEVA